MSAGVGVINGTLEELDTDHASYLYVIGCIVVYGITIAIGLLAVIIFAAALFAGRKTFAQFPFFKIVRHLTIANGSFLFIQAVNIFPSMLIETEGVLPTWLDDLWSKIGDVVTELGEQADLYFTFLMGVNRLFVFAAPRSLWLFQGNALRLILLCTWLLVGGITSIRLTQANPKKFNMKTLSFDDLILEDNTTWAYQATTIAGYIIPLLLIVVYISIFSFLRKKRKSSK
ncbi:hypothetical protein PMAYCL1PPCAC_09152, partial [Pristionchus mayeri]